MIRWLLIALFVPLSVFAQPVQTYRIGDFSGGMVMDYDMTDLPEKYGSWCYNFNSSRGKLSMRSGYTQWMAYSVEGINAAFYKYTISSPNLNSADADSGLLILSENAEITVMYSVYRDSLETFQMYPTYTANDTTPLGDGAWSNEWSGDFNDPSYGDYWRGSSTVWARLHSNGIECFSAYGSVLRMTAGNESSSDPIYTYPWWFGYIGRYRFKPDSTGGTWPNSDVVLDEFYLDYAPIISHHLPLAARSPRPFLINALIADTSFSESKYGLAEGVPIDTGWYYCTYVMEYDGYQYAPITTYSGEIDSLYVQKEHVATADDKMLSIYITFYRDDANYGWPSSRATAILIFTSDAIVPTDDYYTNPQIDNLSDVVPMYLRKRVVIADADTSNLGYSWKKYAPDAVGGQIRWFYNSEGSNWWIYGFVDGDDIKTTNLELWTFLDYASWETVVLPRYSAMVGDQQWVGNVRIDGAISKVKEDYRNMVIISPFGQPDILPINNFLLVGAGGGSYVTGIREFGGQALIWTNDAFEVWMPGVIPYRLDKFIGSGCTVPRSIQITPSGTFWANHKGAYAYHGAGTPRKISKSIGVLFDSLAVATNDYGVDGTSQNTLQYSESVYFPKENQYALFTDSVNAGKPDTLSTSGVWGALSPSRRHGGDIGLVYDIDDGSWSKWELNDRILQFVSGWDATLYGLCSEYPYDIHRFEVSPTDYTYDDNMSASWSSGWTDMGVPGREKEIVGIRADYCLNVATASDTVKPDTLELKVYVDGKDEVYDTYQFYASDSIATGGSNWRRVQWIKSDATGVLITDPARRLPVLYRFDIEMGGDLFYGSSAWGELNALDVDFTVKKQRE